MTPIISVTLTASSCVKGRCLTVNWPVHTGASAVCNDVVAKRGNTVVNKVVNTRSNIRSTSVGNRVSTDGVRQTKHFTPHRGKHRTPLLVKG